MIRRWDLKKKHGFAFDEILDVFENPPLLEWTDWEHSSLEGMRYQCIGPHGYYLLILIVYTDRNGNIRIVSAREASPGRKRRFMSTREKNETKERSISPILQK